MKKTLKVSVLTPIYNHKIEYVRACLESLLAQTMQDIEFILIDNGAGQEAKDLIAEFEEKDKRFKALHIQTNQGYGNAMNLGLEKAQGEYIGIVESDDLVHADMYRDLYQAGEESGAEMVKGLFSFYQNETITKVGLVFPPSQYNRLLKPIDVPDFCDRYGAYWSAIYQRKALEQNGIKFDVMPNPSAEDIMFTLKTWCLFKSLYIVNKSYYYHRIDNENSSIHQKDRIAHDCIALYDQLNAFLTSKGDEVSREQWCIKNRREILNLYYHYKFYNITKHKLSYLLQISKRFKQMLAQDRVCLDKSHLETPFYQIAKHPVKFYFGHCMNKNQDSLIETILSVRNTPDGAYKVFTVFGCSKKFKRKKKEDLFPLLRSHTSVLYYAQKSNIQAATIHPRVFSSYLGKYAGKELAVIGSGPTLNFAGNLEHLIKVGVNRSFLKEGLNLDYLFIQDYLKGEGDMEQANAYNPQSCTKFYGILPENRYNRVKKDLRKITMRDIFQAGAKPYIIEDAFRKNWANLLDIEPIGDWGGCIFSALQFALYTTPAKIYLAGCDCSDNGHFHEERKEVVSSGALSYQYFSWEAFSNHVKRYYPDLEIISINPVGLRGMFKDVYTQAYVDEHPELLEEGVEILPNTKEN